MSLAAVSCANEDGTLDAVAPNAAPVLLELAANGSACTAGDECSSGHCVDAVCCDTACGGGAADCQACDATDAVGTCTLLAVDTECRAAGGACDVAESCDGISEACPSDLKLGGETTCRLSAGVCDPAEVCDGGSDACPEDARTAAGMSCGDDGNPCTRDICDGDAVDCTHPAGNAGAECRVAADVCDATETCDGIATVCPADEKRASGSPCRIAAGACDVAESCDGSTDACPADLVANAGAECPDDGNACTADICDGAAVSCTHPAGNVGATCRDAIGTCDVAETCTGDSTACPTDLKHGNDTPCRFAAGDCDLIEYCDGSADGCPSDQRAPSGAPCRESAGDCDVAETCNGSDAECPSDVRRGDDFVCRPSAGECDVADECDGFGVACPSDAVRPADSPCTADDNVCTRDVCDGASAACTHPAGNTGTECRAASGICDVAETCSGDSSMCPTDTFRTGGEPCRGASCDAGVQVLEALCDGSGASCPNVISEACEAYSCGPDACYTTCSTAAQCAPEHYCDGTACQPQRADGAACTTADQCTSGECVDGYCCNSACAGQCEACDVEDRLGQCSAVTGEPHGDRDACDTDGTNCGGSCDGDTRTACIYPGSSQTCRVASCIDNVATYAAQCGGDGTCGPLVQQPCAPFICDAEQPICLGDCVVDGDCVDGFFCSAGVCTARRALGAACTAPNQCASDRCIDDVCCNAACDGQCEACDVDDAEGTCSPVVGDPHGERDDCNGDRSVCHGQCNGVLRSACDYPDAATNCRLGSCSGGVAIVAAFCDGSGACPAMETQSCAPFQCGGDACLGDCSEDADCVGGSFCNANVCTVKRAVGEPCTAANGCGSGFCVDGVCCGSSCRGQCEACDVSGNVGTCTAVIGAPHGSRPACDSDGSACGGACDGSDPAGCRYPAQATPCREASCEDGVATLAAACVGTGSCPNVQQQTCAPYACGATQCAGDCTDTAGCVTGYFCSAGVCIPRLGQGQTCSANEQCASDVCADGFCCDGPCDGQCEACDVADAQGTCTPVTGAPHGGRAACAGTGTCAGSCDGIETNACTFPGNGVVCTTAACSNGTATRAASCDGAGSCTPATQRDCSPYACGTLDCASTCASDDDCVDGRVCRDAACELPLAADGGSPEPDASTGEPDAGADGGADAGAPIDPELDRDGDGIPDVDELGANGESIDTDDDGIPNELDADDDGDGIPTEDERGRGRLNDLDRDGIANHLDDDADGDGIDDEDEATGDADRDGIPDYKDAPRLGVAGGALCAVQQGGTAPAGPAWLLLAALSWWVARRLRPRLRAARRYLPAR